MFFFPSNARSGSRERLPMGSLEISFQEKIQTWKRLLRNPIHSISPREEQIDTTRFGREVVNLRQFNRYPVIFTAMRCLANRVARSIGESHSCEPVGDPRKILPSFGAPLANALAVLTYISGLLINFKGILDVPWLVCLENQAGIPSGTMYRILEHPRNISIAIKRSSIHWRESFLR